VTPKTQSPDGLHSRLFKALSDPMRLDALRVFNSRATASPNEVANAMNVPVNRLAYHVKVLREAGLIELVDTAQRRGATEHYYRATELALVSRELSTLLPQSVRKGMTGEAIGAIFERITESIEAGVFDARDERHVAWMPLTLDEKGWQDYVDLKARHLEEELEIKAQSQERLAQSDAPTVEATTVSLLFEMP
jgi:DNA-binding transcriptional ArsR family regulator